MTGDEIFVSLNNLETGLEIKQIPVVTKEFSIKWFRQNDFW